MLTAIRKLLGSHILFDQSNENRFNREMYCLLYPDVANSGLDPWQHYREHGIFEGRVATLEQALNRFWATDFDADWYSARYTDVALSRERPIIHFFRHGLLEGRYPNAQAEARSVSRNSGLGGNANVELARNSGLGGEPCLLYYCNPHRDEKPYPINDSRFKVSILTPTLNTPAYCLNELFQTIINQTFVNWEWVIIDNGSEDVATISSLTSIAGADKRVKLRMLPRNLGISEGTNAAFALSSGQFVALVDHDDLLYRGVLESIWKRYKSSPDIDWFYTDECKIGADYKPKDFLFKPGWSPVLLENTMYVCHLVAYSRQLVKRVGGWRSKVDGTQDYDFALRASALKPKVCHIAEVGYLWRTIDGSTAATMSAKSSAVGRQEQALDDFLAATGGGSVTPGFSPGYWRTHLPVPAPAPLLSFVMPTAGGSRVIRGEARDLIRHSIESLISKKFYPNVEFVIVHNGDLSDEQQRYLNSVPSVNIIEYKEEEFNLSRKINIGAEAARGRYLCLINDDIEAITERGGEELVGLLENRDDVAVVAPVCLFEDGRVQHNGVVLFEFGLSHAGIFGSPGENGGEGNYLRQRREVLAVTGAFAVVRRADFFAVGGFEERLPLNYNDVDFCLKFGALGRTCVVDPYVSVYHFESVSKIGTFKCERETLFARWPEIRDPYLNPNLDQRDQFYRLAQPVPKLSPEMDPVVFEYWLDRWIAMRMQKYDTSEKYLISVCVPVYNQSACLLEEMYQSIKFQSYGNKELVIVDDGSTRIDTMIWLDNASKSKSLRVVRHGKNRGIAAANRTLLASARGEFVVMVDADDFLTIDALQILAHWIEKNPERDVFYSDEFKSNSSSEKFSPFFKREFDPFMSVNCCYHCHVMALRREVLIDLHAYGDDRAAWCHDWDTVTRAWSAGKKLVHVPELLYAWRINPGSTASANTAQKPETVASQNYVLKRLIHERGLDELVEVAPNEIHPSGGMWRLRAKKPVQCVATLSRTDFWSAPAAETRKAKRAGSTWIAIIGSETDESEAILELSALAHWDEHLTAASGIFYRTDQKTVHWSGAVFASDGLLDTCAGKTLVESYHGEGLCQRCVDVVAPVNVLVRTSELAALFDEHGDDLPNDDVMLLLGREAAAGGKLVAVTPHVTSVWYADDCIGLPLGRNGSGASARPTAPSRWYDPRLGSDRPYRIAPEAWAARAGLLQHPALK